ncbi:MAG: hypothetical protein KQ78_01829 [Candidatus Izimaplasma bacterium HR2]|nr:MAG: hypothetical protein KQ78_01829 [Candidatus Izimaplasma bacterium HR2]
MKKLLSVYEMRLKRIEACEVNDALIEYTINSPTKISEIADLLEARELAQEKFWVIALNTKNKIIGIGQISSGTLNCSIVHPRDVFKYAIAENCSSIILMHNHPSGNPEPSGEDFKITEKLCDCGELLGIKVLDHIIIGSENKFYSFKEYGTIE